jgi:hypothetical protein
MTLGHVRELGVRNLIAFCHNDACRHRLEPIIAAIAYHTDEAL